MNKFYKLLLICLLMLSGGMALKAQNVDDTFSIESKEDLITFADLVENKKSLNARLYADIDLEGGYWSTICETALYYNSYSNDANAEFIGWLRGILEKDNVVWQTGELGKVDCGGGGTVDKCYNTGKIAGGSWSGNGWTGQPLIVQWDAETRQLMNLYADKKNKSDLVEVIYATLDGHIYFLDLETGKKTRDDLNFKMPFKGTGSIDPRGLPLLYVGSGDEYEEEDQKSRAMIISLIDGRKLYEFGIQGKDKFAVRDWNA